MSKQRENIDIEYLGGAVYFDDFTGIDTHQFDFNITIDDKKENIEIFVAGSHQAIDRVGMRENFNIVFEDEATYKYIMDEIDTVVKEEFEKEHQELLQFMKDIENGVGIASKDFGDKEPEQKPKQNKGKGFSPSM